VRVFVERRAPWIAAAVLVAGIAAFGITRLTHHSSPAALPHRAAPLTAAERRVTYVFLGTAVARKHLDQAWKIVAPELKQGMSLEEWKTGTIPVVPYPVGDAHAMLHVVNSFTDTAQVRVTFVPRPGSKVGGATFTLGLRNIDGQWLASTWQPTSSIAPHQGA
jgi:hypothetical protein